jgi:hypothetical protein
MPLYFDDPLVRLDMGYVWPPDPSQLKHLGGKHMNHVALNSSGLSVKAKLTKGDMVVAKCTGNTALGTPPPGEIAEVTNATVRLRAAHADTAGKKKAWQEAAVVEHGAEKDWDTAHADLGGIVDVAATAAENPAVVVASTGYDLRSAPVPVVMVQVTNFSTSISDTPGGIDGMHNPVEGRRVYIVQITEDLTGATGWQQALMPTASNWHLTNLVSGKRYCLRVCAVGPGGVQGPWSDLSQCMAG